MCVGFYCYIFLKSDVSYILFDMGVFLVYGFIVYLEVWKVSDKEIVGWEMMECIGCCFKDIFVYFYV